jgi:ubiquinone/menaquinone biosynthesis C-methylase UbiE
MAMKRLPARVHGTSRAGAQQPNEEVPVADSIQSFREFEHAGWEDAGVVARYHEQLSAVTMQSTSALLDVARVSKGSRLLDVATGAGYVAGAAAGRGAEAIGIDFSASQLRLARQTYPAVRFEQADAEALPFGPATFDAVINSFGMCHLSNPDLALREAFRVLRPGGRIAFAVWDVPERAAGFGALYDAVGAYGSMDVGLPVGPNFFFFSDPARSTKALLDAGFASPSCQQVPQVWRLADADQLFEVVAEGTVRAAATLRSQTPGARVAIRTAVREAVMNYRHGDHFEVPMPAVIASAVKA